MRFGLGVPRSSRFTGNGSGASRGDRDRNARLARLRVLVPVSNAIARIVLAGRQMVVVTAATAEIADLSRFAGDLAGFLTALYQVDPRSGPAAGYDTCFFGVPLAHWDPQTRRALAALAGHIDIEATTSVWEAALAAAWDGPAVWFHGDVSPGNLLVEEGRLSAVIDFGIAGVGDPACDTAIAWTVFTGKSRSTYKSLLPVDDATWARGRGWALWKAGSLLPAWSTATQLRPLPPSTSSTPLSKTARPAHRHRNPSKGIEPGRPSAMLAGADLTALAPHR